MTLHVPNASAVDTFEPNDTRQTATPIVSGSPLVSYVSTAGDIDYYQFTLSSSQHVRIDLAVPDAVDCRLDVYDADGFFVGGVDAFDAGVDERLERTLVAGSYYIRINGTPTMTSTVTRSR